MRRPDENHADFYRWMLTRNTRLPGVVAPTLQDKGGPAELEEAPRGSGLRRAIGELIVCPYCLGLWVVAAMTLGIAVAPRLTRFIASVFSALTVSDFLQIAYKAAEEKGL